jgi:hypothetical protein
VHVPSRPRTIRVRINFTTGVPQDETRRVTSASAPG